MPDSPNFLHKITGSFAQPAAENPTVEMIEAAYRHHNLHWRYINFEVAPENLGDAVRGARGGDRGDGDRTRDHHAGAALPGARREGPARVPRSAQVRGLGVGASGELSVSRAFPDCVPSARFMPLAAAFGFARPIARVALTAPDGWALSGKGEVAADMG